VVEPEPSPDITALLAPQIRKNPPQEVRDAALIMIAVKPQSVEMVMPTIARLVAPRTVVVSIMAGVRLAGLERRLPPGTAVVRAMPNLPAAIGRGITVAVPNAAMALPSRNIVNEFLEAIGAVEWLEDESVLDAVTAVSGSGPAYVFLLTETLAQAGVAAGLSAELAARLARATVAGAGQLLEALPAPPATLRENVTSPGGTTAAALDILMGQNGLAVLMERAVGAAMRRSRELAGSDRV
jgi:pyrroline-5-carboxylate reductase